MSSSMNDRRSSAPNGTPSTNYGSFINPLPEGNSTGHMSHQTSPLQAFGPTSRQHSTSSIYDAPFSSSAEFLDLEQMQDFSSSSEEHRRSRSPPDAVGSETSSQDIDESQRPGADPSILNATGTALRRGMACTFCRKRKLRCSGQRPTCEMCIKYKKSCEYMPTAPRRLRGGRNASGRKDAGDTTQSAQSTASSSSAAHPSNRPTPSAADRMVALTANTPAGSLSGFTNLLSGGNDVPSNPLLTTNRGIQNQGVHQDSPDFSAFLNYSTSPSNVDFTYADGLGYSSSVAPNSFAGIYSTVASDSSAASWIFPDGGQQNANCGLDRAQGSQTTSHIDTSHTGNDQGQFPMFSVPQNTFGDVEMPQSRTTQLDWSLPSSNPAELISQSQLNSLVLPEFTEMAQSDSSIPLVGSMDTGMSTNNIMQPTQINLSSSAGSTIPDFQMERSDIADPLRVRSLDTTAKAYSAEARKSPSGKSWPHRISAHIEPIEGLTERLGEFMFRPTEKETLPTDSQSIRQMRQHAMFHSGERHEDGAGSVGGGILNGAARTGAGGWQGFDLKAVIPMSREAADDLTDAMRESLIETFLAHSHAFFEMSVPRFRRRLAYKDERHPAPALLNVMYLWALQLSHSPLLKAWEYKFFVAAAKSLDVSSASGDRLMDCIRAANLLSAWSFSFGRFHEGWILSGMAVRFVLSTGLHQIKSCIFTPQAPTNPFLRNRVFLLDPPKDALELGERIHTFWAVYLLDRCGAASTGFSAGLLDDDIITPFPRPLADIASGAVTRGDDVTVKDLYRRSFNQREGDTSMAKFLKACTLVERAAKLNYLEPEQDTEYSRAWAIPTLNAAAPRPPAWLEQPKHRNPCAFFEIKLGVDQLTDMMGSEGVFPVDRLNNAKLDKVEPPAISAQTMFIHHQFCVIHMLLHDINSLDCENTEALRAAAKCIRLIKEGPHMDHDAFTCLIWSMVAKVLCKEMRRLHLLGDHEGCHKVCEDVNLLIEEMQRVGQVMAMARTQARAIEELRNMTTALPSV